MLYPAFCILRRPVMAALAMWLSPLSLSSVSVIGNPLRLRTLRMQSGWLSETLLQCVPRYLQQRNDGTSPMVFETAQGAGACATRSVSQWERALLAQWLSATERLGSQAVAAAYVSDRSQDDLRLRNMIVIAERNKSDRDFLIHRPLGENAWIVTDGRTEAELGRFRTLPEALHLIRPLRNQSLLLTSSHADDQLTDAARRQ